MKHLYMIARNHMDPMWQKGFTDYYTDPDSGDVCRPYSDLEELQILEYMDLAEKYGVVYHIEQSLVVRKFLERNPDQLERFRALQARGLFELAGGGQCVIDMNLTQGESWARNHLYSRKYYKEMFGHAPRYAITPDIFGVPAQAPQFFRSIGYDALIVFDRVLKKNRPFWRGLDGTLIVLDSKWLQPPEPYLRAADCVTFANCPFCRGEGCPSCQGTGLDLSYNMTRPDKKILPGNYYANMSAEDMLDRLLASGKDEFFVMIVTEQLLTGDHLYGQLRALAPQKGVEVHFIGFEENHDTWCPGQVARLRAGDYAEGEIETRPEGNPASTGDCTSRIEIKKANRELENLLLEAEALSVIAKRHGGYAASSVPSRAYPARKLAELWGKMALIQFHDCVTGTLSDGAYEELKKYVRQVRRGGEQIYRDAALELLRHTAPEVPAGFEAAVFFNPTRHAMRQATLCFNAPEDTASVQVFDRALRQLDVVGCDVKTAKVGTSLKATVLADVPPFSARVFFWKPSTAAQTVKSVTTAGDGDAAVENDFFRVKTDGRRIIEVFGKAQNRALLRDAALTLSEDIGSPWGREVPEKVIGRFEASSVTVERGEARQRITLKGQYRDAQVRTLDWRVSYTLNRGEDLIRVSTDIDWNGDQRHVYASFAPAFPFEEDLYCEVPFGMLKRPVIRDVNVLGICDEWPSLGYAGVEGDGVSFALLKGGHAGTSVKDGLIRLSLLRAPGYREPGFVKSYEGANDKGRHQAEFALAFAPCRFEDASFSEKAGAFAAAGHCECITGESAGYLGVTGEDDTVPLDAPLLPQLASLPSGVRISALKLAEDGKRTILRVWEGEGRPVLYALPEGIAMRRCTTLEEPADEFWTNTLSLRPFEIATFEIQFD